jgi:hypothetical protein
MPFENKTVGEVSLDASYFPLAQLSGFLFIYLKTMPVTQTIRDETEISKKNVKQSRYRPGVAQRVPGS